MQRNEVKCTFYIHILLREIHHKKSNNEWSHSTSQEIYMWFGVCCILSWLILSMFLRMISLVYSIHTIMDKGFGPCPTNDNINSKGLFSELLFSFVLGKYTICDICTMKSPAFETTSLLYVTPTDSSSMQELLMQEHKQKLYKTGSCCGRDTWHIESKKILQPPNYLIIIVNRITYSNNRITKNKSRIPLDLYIKLGPYKFSLQASVDHHGYSMNSGHYTASINCCGKTFHCNDDKITECNITDTYNSSTAYILLYKLMLC